MSTRRIDQVMGDTAWMPRGSRHEDMPTGWPVDPNSCTEAISSLISHEEACSVPDEPPDPWQDVDMLKSQMERAAIDLSQIIRHAFSALAPKDAIGLIESIWQQLDGARDLAEARMRILLKRVNPPADGPDPEWLSAGLAELGDNENKPHPQAIKSARLLVRACLAACGEQHRASFDVDGMGGIEVHWDVPHRLTWAIRAAELPWPGVNARVYARRDPMIPGLEVQTFHQAFALLDHACGLLGQGSK